MLLLMQTAQDPLFCDHGLVRKLSVAGRKEGAKLLFVGLWVAGVVQSVLLAEGIGTSAGIRYGVGVPLVLGSDLHRRALGAAQSPGACEHVRALRAGRAACPGNRAAASACPTRN